MRMEGGEGWWLGESKDSGSVRMGGCESGGVRVQEEDMSVWRVRYEGWGMCEGGEDDLQANKIRRNGYKPSKNLIFDRHHQNM